MITHNTIIGLLKLTFVTYRTPTAWIAVQVDYACGRNRCEYPADERRNE